MFLTMTCSVYYCFSRPVQTGNVWRPNILPFGHLVWYCLIFRYHVWSCLIKFEGHQTFDQTTENISFVLVFDGRCFVRFDSRVSNMLDAGMRTTLAQRLVSIVWSVFDQTCFNRLATHFNISMLGHQIMFDGVWSPNISRLSRALDGFSFTVILKCHCSLQTHPHLNNTAFLRSNYTPGFKPFTKEHSCL